MPILIPVTFFGTLVLTFIGIGKHGLRQSIVYAATVYTTCLVCATELFSIWNLLSFELLLAFWIGCTILSTFCFWAYGDRRATRQTLQRTWAASRTQRFELGVVVVILAIILLIAVVAPPNNWESMIYRMMRIVMWMQQESIAHYPTTTLSQLHRCPLSAWNVLHFQILSGGDRFANTVHWFALAGCGVLTSLIAKELKQTFPVQVLAAVIAVTLPMGLVQGSSTQGNLVAAFWLLAFTVFTLQYFKKPSGVCLVCCGLATGFALLSKGTAYPIAPPLAATLFLYGITRTTNFRSWVRLAGLGTGIVVVALLVNSGHYWRNYSLFGNPLFSTEGSISQINEQITILTLISNLVRNGALHLGLPSEKVNDLTLDTIRRVFGDWLDSVPGTTLGVSLFEAGIPFDLDEYHTGNFLHFSFLSASLLGILLFRRRLEINALTVCLALAVVFGTISFCSLLQWQLFNSRYHTPLFMLGAPLGAIFVARMLSRVGTRRKARPNAPTSSSTSLPLNCIVDRRRSMIAGTFLVMSVPWIISNDIRPLYPLGIWQTHLRAAPSIFSRSRTHMYFNSISGIFSPYVDAMDFLSAQNPKEVGLYLPESSFFGGYDYAVWNLLKEKCDEMPRVKYVGVLNDSGKLHRGSDVPPPFIFTIHGRLPTLEGESYSVVWQRPPVTILERQNPPKETSEGWKRILED